MEIRRRRWTYSFRAWIDERGSNEDHAHRDCEAPRRCLGLEPYSCKHLRLWDLNTTSGGRNILRIVRGRWVRGGRWMLRAYIGPKYWRWL